MNQNVVGLLAMIGGLVAVAAFSALTWRSRIWRWHWRGAPVVGLAAALVFYALAFGLIVVML
jgi:hypothetical protein